jgi:hypothetical protein
MPSGISVTRESCSHTRKISMIWLVGGSMRIWKSQLALQLPSPPSIARRAERFRGSKDSATEHLARVGELVAILETHGVPVRMLKRSGLAMSFMKMNIRW